MRYPQLRSISLLLFFLAGFSALIYEVTWVRLLSLDFGVSVYAVSAVLTAYMGGLALGSWLFGRVAATRTEPGALLRLYALLLVCTGVCGLLSLLVFTQLAALYVWIYRQFAPDFYTFNLLRFGLAALVLCLPTSLMGGTLVTGVLSRGVDATVSVFDVPDPPLKISFVNGRSEVPTDPQSMRAFYMLGHLPPLLRPAAQSALMVSFGNGIASGAISRHSIRRIQAVELVAEQVAAARLYRQENRGVLEYPGLKITIEDGRNYLLRSDEQFDIITADATHPVNSSSWALFTREFYTLVRQRLAKDGVFVQWLPFHDLSARDFRDIIKTYQSIFPHTSLFYTGGSHSFMVATPRPLTRADVAALDARIKAAGVADDLGDGQKLAADMLMDEQAVARYVDSARVVTDDSAFFIPAKEMDAILQSWAPYVQVGQTQP